MDTDIFHDKLYEQWRSHMSNANKKKKLGYLGVAERAVPLL